MLGAITNVPAKFEKNQPINAAARGQRRKTTLNTKPEVERKKIVRFVQKKLRTCRRESPMILQSLRKIEFGKNYQIVFENPFQILVKNMWRHLATAFTKKFP